MKGSVIRPNWPADLSCSKKQYPPIPIVCKDFLKVTIETILLDTFYKRKTVRFNFNPIRLNLLVMIIRSRLVAMWEVEIGIEVFELFRGSDCDFIGQFVTLLSYLLFQLFHR